MRHVGCVSVKFNACFVAIVVTPRSSSPDYTNQIVYYDDDDPAKNLRAVDLWTHYSQIKTSDIARSNSFYNHYDSQYKLNREDLIAMQKLFENNASPSLARKVNEEYNQFKPEEQGGNLWLKIALNKISSSSRDHLTNLIAEIGKMNLQQHDGENVGAVVSTIRAITNRIDSTIDPSLKNTIYPPDFRNKVIQIFKTSSFPDFTFTVPCHFHFAN